MGAELLSSRAIRGMIQQSLVKTEVDPWVGMMTREFESDQVSEIYRWLSDVPALKLWKGGRNIKELVAHGIEIRNEEYEAGIQVSKAERRRDKLGQLEMKIADLSRRVASHWTKLSTELLEANPTAYDGVSFFSSSHAEEDSGTQDNNISVNVATPDSPDAGEMKTAVLTAVESLMGFKDGAGEPVSDDARQFLVMVPTNMFASTATALGNSVIVESGAAVTNTITNIAGFGFSQATNPRLSAADAFYVARTDSAIPAIIRQDEFGPNIAAKAEGSDYEFDTNLHQYGVDVNRAVGPGRWQNVVKVTLT